MWRSRLRLVRFLLVCAGITLPLLAAEGALRFLPVIDYIRVMPLNASQPVVRYVPNQRVRWSAGWNFSTVNAVRINNDGFVSDQDYEAAGPPMVAVIGDSYVEALNVPYQSTTQGRLQATVGARGRVYSFGKSGAPLSGYLIWARHARQAFGASAMVISVVGNDFDESLAAYRTVTAGHYYVRGENDDLLLRQSDYQPSRWRLVLAKSALVRYLLWDIGIRGALQARMSKVAFVGNVAASKSAQVVEESEQAVNAFFRDLPSYSGLPADRIVFTLDAMRPEIYDSTALKNASGSYFGRMRHYFLMRARELGYEVIDLQDAFRMDFAANHMRFETAADNHWNAVGHAVVAAHVRRSGPFRAVFGE